MAIVQNMCNSFKQECLLGEHDLDTDVLKIALYTSAANLSATTTAYSATDEASGTGYTAGGQNLANVTVSLSSGVAYVSFDNPSWPGASFTARGALIYNSTVSNKAVAVIDFGEDKTASATTFTIVLPSNSPTAAIIRFA